MNNKYTFTDQEWREFKKEWMEFKVGDLFKIFVGKDKPNLNNLDYSKKIRILKNQTSNNSLFKIDYIDFKNNNRVFKNYISVTSQEGVAFYQEKNSIGVGRLKSLIPQFNLNKYISLFISEIITYKLKNIISYGRALNGDRIKNTIINLPIKKDSNNNPIINESKKYHPQGFIPDFEFMELYIKNIFNKLPSIEEYKQKKEPNNKYTFTDQEWREFKKEWMEFKVGDLFKIFVGKDKPNLNNLDYSKKIRILKNQTSNNSLFKIDYIDFKNNNRVFKNYISVTSQEGVAFYQEKNSIGVGRLKSLIPQFNLNKYIALFISEIITYKLKNIISYGRALNGDRIKNTIINLPIKKDSNNNPIINESKKYHPQGFIPDFEFMEGYIKNLNYSKYL